MNSPLTRRAFLARTALLPLAAALPIRRVAAEFAPPVRVGGPFLKPALNAYSFLELLQANAQNPATGIDLVGVCHFAAKENFAAVDLTGYFFPGYPAAPDPGYLVRIKRLTHDLGLDISGTGVRNDFTNADPAVRAAGIAHIKEWVEVAARLGAPALRVFADSQPPYKKWQEAAPDTDREKVEAWMSDALRECAVHAEKFGVLIAVQNHGDFINTGAEHLSLLRRVDHPWCSALVDTGKYFTDDPYADIALMAPYAANWQIKETLRSRTDSPRVDMKKLIGLIRAAGYRGYLPIETLSMRRKDYDPFTEVSKLHAEMREAIAAG